MRTDLGHFLPIVRTADEYDDVMVMMILRVVATGVFAR